MFKDYLVINRTLRNLNKSFAEHRSSGVLLGNEGETLRNSIIDFILRDLRDLEFNWPKDLKEDHLEELKRKLNEAAPNLDRIHIDLVPLVENVVDAYFLNKMGEGK